MLLIRVIMSEEVSFIVITGEFRNAFACIRPPGHHAGTDGLLTTASSCGFCVIQ